MLTDGFFSSHSLSLLGEFDQRKQKYYPLEVANKQRKHVTLPQEIIEASKSRGLSLSNYLEQLHYNQRSVRIAYVASIFRGFALLEMARLPIEPSYFELVEGCLGEKEGLTFRQIATSGIDYALCKASAKMLGADTRATAIESILLASQRAQVLHEGFIEAARLLEATYFR